MRYQNTIHYVEIDNNKLLEKFEGLLPKKSDYGKEFYLKIGAIDGERNLPVGIVVFTVDEYGTFIEYIYVDKDYRRKGIGSNLLECLEEWTMKSSVEYHKAYGLSCSFDTSNEELFRFFYQRADMDIEFEGDVYILQPQDLKQSEVLNRLNSSPRPDTSFARLEEPVEEMCIKQLIYITPSLRKSDFEGISRELSQVEIENGQVVAGLIMRQREDGDLELSYIRSTTKQMSTVAGMIANAYKAWLKLYPDKCIYTKVVNEKIDMKRLFPGKIPEDYMCVADWNYLPMLSKKATEMIGEE